MEVDRVTDPETAPLERIKNWREFKIHSDEKQQRAQGSRCMDCGTPFCHTGHMVSGMASGCPVNNLIPEWNDLIFRGRWKEALEAGRAPPVRLTATHEAALSVVPLADLKKRALDLV